eukprot:scaffold1725_cov355-Pavlova_lutheri.AAC.2
MSTNVTSRNLAVCGSSVCLEQSKPAQKLLPRPPPGVTFGVRAQWDNNLATMLIRLRGIELLGEFDVSKGKYMDTGWRKVRQAMLQKLGHLAPWFVSGEGSFRTFCGEHGVDKEVYLEDMFKAKASEKWKGLQDTYKLAERRTVTVVDHNGLPVKRKANCTGEQKLDDIAWPLYDVMDEAMKHKPSVCPPPGAVLQTQHSKPASPPTPTGGPVSSDVDDNPLQTLVSLDEQNETYMTCDEQHKKRSARDDEADSPHRKIIPPSKRGKRPSSADRRHEELLSAVMDQSSAVTESLEVIRTSITDMQKQYQMFDLQKQIMDCAQKIQRNWDERFAFLLSQKVPPDLIIEQLGPRPTKEEATKEVQSWKDAIEKSCQF